ncbi:MAG: hypothetical protein U5K00_09150 [Melioribacteraceae bacterium]|nr:hypothetical protein [Melioribacteraceae bacterium]
MGVEYDTIPSNNLIKFFEKDKNGNIWAFPYYGNESIYVLEKGSWEIFSKGKLSKIGSDIVTSSVHLKQRDTTILVASTYNKLNFFRYSSRRDTSFTQLPLTNLNIRDIYFADNKVFYCSSRKGFLNMI